MIKVNVKMGLAKKLRNNGMHVCLCMRFSNVKQCRFDSTYVFNQILLSVMAVYGFHTSCNIACIIINTRIKVTLRRLIETVLVIGRVRVKK